MAMMMREIRPARQRASPRANTMAAGRTDGSAGREQGHTRRSRSCSNMSTLEHGPHRCNGRRSRHGFRHAKLSFYMCIFALLLPRLAFGHFFSARAAPVRTAPTGAAASSTKAAANAVEDVFITTKQQRPWSNYTMRILYILTAVNPALSVIANDYNTRIPVPGCVPTPTRPYAATVYRTLFYFARCNNLKHAVLHNEAAAHAGQLEPC
eukprot:6209636-Pleurochrysis_carterae.AAC.1